MYSFYFIKGSVKEDKLNQDNIDDFFNIKFGLLRENQTKSEDEDFLRDLYCFGISKLTGEKKTKPWKSIDFDYCKFFQVLWNSKKSFAHIVCDEVKKISIVLMVTDDFQDIFKNIPNKKIIKKIDIERSEISCFTENFEKRYKKSFIDQLLDCEEEEGLHRMILSIRVSLEEYGFLNVKEASNLAWRLKYHNIKHEPSDFKVKVLKNENVFPFLGIRQWQFDQLYPYLEAEDKQIYGFLHSDKSKSFFEFLS